MDEGGILQHGMRPPITLVGALVIASMAWLSALPASAGGIRIATCDGQAPTILGTSNRDVLTGTAGRDVIVSRGGDDVIRALGGGDLVCGGWGDDAIHGGGGSELIFGGAGNDSIRGGSDGDNIRADTGDDEIRGQGGSDGLLGLAGNDVLEGGGGRDFLSDSKGNNILRGGPNADRLDGGLGDDILNGGGGTDTAVFDGSRDAISVELRTGTATGYGRGRTRRDRIDQRIPVRRCAGWRCTTKSARRLERERRDLGAGGKRQALRPQWNRQLERRTRRGSLRGRRGQHELRSVGA